jgi:hypothetical protein
MPEHHTSRRAHGLKMSAARQQKRRNNLKEIGMPTTHVLNRAIAEGLLYYLEAERVKGVAPNDIRVSVKDVLGYAIKVLSRRTNGTDQYDPRKVKNALQARIAKESPVKFRIAPTWTMPVRDDD